MHLHCIGAGRVGLSLGPRLLESGLLKAGIFIANKDVVPHKDLWPGRFTDTLHSLRGVQTHDFLLCAVGDDQLEDLALALGELELPPLNIWHCSGAKSSRVFQSLKEQGHQIASIHPAFSFVNPKGALEELRLQSGLACGVEGDLPLLEKLRPVYEKIGFKNWIHLEESQKLGYHLAQTYACNYWVLLLGEAQKSFASAGIGFEEAKKILEPLLRGTLANFLGASKPMEALSGPVARGDMKTLNSHLDYANLNQLDGIFLEKLIAKTLHWKEEGGQ